MQRTKVLPEAKMTASRKCLRVVATDVKDQLPEFQDLRG